MKTPKKSSLPEKWDEADEIPARGSGDSVSYLGRLTRQRLLTYEEEVALAARVQRGDARAKERLVEANMRLVINIAKNYHNCLVPFEDLVQEGAIGLMTATERFDPNKGYRFSTYATHWIRQAISRAIDNKSKAIRVPAHVSEILRKLERIRLLLFREQGEEPTTEQLAQHMGISARKIHMLLQAGQEPVSLDMLVGEEENTTLAALINDRSAANPQEMILIAEMRQEIDNLLAILTPREREDMHISRERVRQIEVQALKKLKFAAKRRDLRSYMSE